MILKELKISELPLPTVKQNKIKEWMNAQDPPIDDISSIPSEKIEEFAGLCAQESNPT